MKEPYRITEYYKHFLVEILVYKWTLFGIKNHYKPYITWNGTNEGYLFSSYRNAENALLMKIKEKVMIQFPNNINN